MNPKMALVLVLITGVSFHGLAANENEPPSIESYLRAGDLAAGQAAMQKQLSANPDDQLAQLSLGTVQFLSSIERVAQQLYSYGAMGDETAAGRMIPILRLAVPENPDPKRVEYNDVRQLLQRFVDDLAVAEKTLSKVDDPKVQLPLHFGMIRLDLDGNGTATEEETLWRLYAGLNRGLQLGPDFKPDDAESFVIDFDLADAYWLRGYCHLLSGMCEMALAYDEEECFNTISNQLFARPDDSLLQHEAFVRQPFDEWADLIAAIHRADFRLVEPERMRAAHKHFVNVIDLSRSNWIAIQAEMDDRAEWIPNPRQTGVIPQVPITREMIAGWHEFLDEAELLLSGEKLIPHWRFKDGYGVNLKRVFEEPRDFDLVMWIHGEGIIPFVEEGPTTSTSTWSQLDRLFRGQFIGFAFWFN